MASIASSPRPFRVLDPLPREITNQLTRVEWRSKERNRVELIENIMTRGAASCTAFSHSGESQNHGRYFNKLRTAIMSLPLVESSRGTHNNIGIIGDPGVWQSRLVLSRYLIQMSSSLSPFGNSMPWPGEKFRLRRIIRFIFFLYT